MYDGDHLNFAQILHKFLNNILLDCWMGLGSPYTTLDSQESRRHTITLDRIVKGCRHLQYSWHFPNDSPIQKTSIGTLNCSWR